MVEIKPFDLQNVTIHYKWNNDPELTYYDSEYPHEHESFDDFLKRVKAVVDDRNQTAELFEIHLKENNTLIGIVDVHAIDEYNQRCFVNCTIGDPEYANKEYDIAAMKIILGYCFNERGLHKVATTAFDFNTLWIDHVKELGFAQEGELREHVLKKGEFSNKLIFSILEDEYHEMYSEQESQKMKV